MAVISEDVDPTCICAEILDTKMWRNPTSKQLEKFEVMQECSSHISWKRLLSQSCVGLCKKIFIQSVFGLLGLDNRRLGDPIIKGKDKSIVAEKLTGIETCSD